MAYVIASVISLHRNDIATLSLKGGDTVNFFIYNVTYNVNLL